MTFIFLLAFFTEAFFWATACAPVLPYVAKSPALHTALSPAPSAGPGTRSEVRCRTAVPLALCLRGGSSVQSAQHSDSVEVIEDEEEQADLLAVRELAPREGASKRRLRHSQMFDGDADAALDGAVEDGDSPGFTSAEHCRASLRAILDRPGLLVEIACSNVLFEMLCASAPTLHRSLDSRAARLAVPPDWSGFLPRGLSGTGSHQFCFVLVACRQACQAMCEAGARNSALLQARPTQGRATKMLTAAAGAACRPTFRLCSSLPRLPRKRRCMRDPYPHLHMRFGHALCTRT